MGFPAQLVTFAGLVLLAHAGYSAQEHAALSSTLVNLQLSSKTLPLDISIETIVATLIVSLGLIWGSPQLRPIQWHVWAGKIEREGIAGSVGQGKEAEKKFQGNPFSALEFRSGFVDIRKQRRDFADWAKSGK
ncbi:unnamed protein product [Clonostachys rosea f. rosea IK726]|uniref:Magnesium transporter n=2 Tax=Bionectria ochroleuca TaxID=29856 RepID=A0A0B7KEH5_BIOOC|nr:unnamed protein product [Clonostachys rosea f. rosea IK726]